MDKIIKILAIVANVGLILAVFILWAEEQPRGPQVLIFLLPLAAPALSLLALKTGPDLEERRLRQQVAKAELRQRLKDLGLKDLGQA